ncbi:MAG: sigma-54-dependent Fis family transcriptional regulator [Bryobacteraceae bacterium]|nr:sigma-54-dependent Fis family transcriptional regulator [Bryobacteraceae bacterium]
MVKGKVLVIDGDEAVCCLLKRWLEPEGCQVGIATTAAEALDAFEKQRWDLAIVELRMPDMDGLEFQSRVVENDPEVPVIITTAAPSVETAIRALKRGAYDYIVKPLEQAGLVQLAGRALEHTRGRREARLRENLRQASPEAALVGQSPAMKKVIEMVDMVAPTNASVLITGESGTGREMIARAIHAGSPRSAMPMVVTHCGALTGSLLERELFGQEQGTFPEEQFRRRGKFEIADGGTVFLDEVGEIEPKAQSDLLRVLQEREIVRVGGAKPVRVDFRCIAATNRNLEQAVRQGAFRSQLYYRLNTFSIEVPPLRERREDIPLLVSHFLNKYSRLLNRPTSKISKRAMDLLLAYSWPGNVRELENAIERALLIRADGSVQPEDFPFQLSNAATDNSLSLLEVERRHIERVVRESNWNLSKSARMLRIDRTTLYNKLKRYGLR